MAHTHSVKDKDTHFLIDALTMKISCASEVKALKRGDHLSEKYTFSMPRYIEEHDMSLCNKVEIHFNNIKVDTATRVTKTNSSFDDAKDFGVSKDNEDIVTWTWHVNSDATQFDGTLNFCVRFACVNGEEILYQKFTEIYKSIKVGGTIWNTETVEKKYADVLEAWRQEVFAAIESGGVGGVTEAEVEQKVSAAKEELVGTLEDTVDDNTIRGAKAYSKEQYEKANEYTVGKVKAAKKELIGFSDDEETANTINGAKNYAKKLFDSYDASEAVEAALTEAKESGEFNGVDGKDGAAGADGQDGENGLSAYQIWLQQGNTGSEADFLESLKGADGASGKDGAKGSDGEDGKDGTSVTVSSVTESTADGGENVVTFSDGKTLTVKNGSKGSKGDKGDPGEKGEQGIQGEQGEKGADGAKGDKGDKGDSGVYVGSGEMPEGYYIQIDPEGDSSVGFLTEEDKAEIAEQVQAVCVAKNQGASNVGKILVVGTDGNLTLTEMPEDGNGVAY